MFTFKFIAFASPASGCVTGTPLLLLFSKNMLSHFSNPAFGVTKPKDAAYPVTGLDVRYLLKNK